MTSLTRELSSLGRIRKDFPKVISELRSEREIEATQVQRKNFQIGKTINEYSLLSQTLGSENF